MIRIQRVCFLALTDMYFKVAQSNINIYSVSQNACQIRPRYDSDTQTIIHKTE